MVLAAHIGSNELQSMILCFSFVGKLFQQLGGWHRVPETRKKIVIIMLKKLSVLYFSRVCQYVLFCCTTCVSTFFMLICHQNVYFTINVFQLVDLTV